MKRIAFTQYLVNRVDCMDQKRMDLYYYPLQNLLYLVLDFAR